MAGDWIKMRGNLWDDPRVARICDMTDANEASVIGALYWLWSTADQHTEDGCMPGLTLRQIDRKTGVQGFGAALVAIGWLADDPQGVVIQGFEEHNGASAKKRCQTAKRVASFKSGNAPSVTESLAERDLEKRREEKKETNTEPTVLVASPSAPRLPACPSEEIVRLYHDNLPMLPRVEILSDSRKRALSARWREVITDPGMKGKDLRSEGIDWFAWFFGHAAKSAFLTGRAKDWRADFDFLITPNKFVKVCEGHYHKEAA